MAMGPAGDNGVLPRAKGFRQHLSAYLAVFALVLIANLGFGAGVPAFWPIAVWTVAVAIHYFIASAYDVNEDWMNDRAFELRTRSYDFDHIRNIQDRIKKRDDTVVHHEERDK